MPRLVLLVVVLVLAAAGLVGVGRRAGRRGELLAAVGLALALATVTASVVERVSFDDRSIGLQPGLVDVTTTAAWLEVVSVGVLAVALALVVVPVVLPGPSAALGTCRSCAAPHVAQPLAGRLARDPRVAHRPSTGPVAALRDDAPPGSTHTPSVGFSDDPD